MSSRRLRKDVLCADSEHHELSKAAGHVTLLDQQGTPRSVRVVQQEERENFNIVSVAWIFSLDDRTHQIELRHGRISGIRKIYLNKQLVERVKNLSSAIFASTIIHTFDVAGRTAEIKIVPGKSGGFKYYLEIDGEAIEREIGIKSPGLSIDVGTHFVQLVKSSTAGFGLTLANCGMRNDGVVIVQLEPNSPAAQAGLLIGDIILAVDDTMAVDTAVILDQLCNADAAMLEVAGSSPSRSMQVYNPFLGSGDKGALTLMETACGVGLYVLEIRPWTGASAPGGAYLEIGDVILSVNGAVTESARETLKYIKKGPPMLNLVVAGRALAAHAT